MKHKALPTLLAALLLTLSATRVLAGDQVMPAGEAASVRVPAPEEMPPADDFRIPTAVRVDGRPVSFDQPPTLVDGVLMVPVRFIAEAAGGTVSWNQDEWLVKVRLSDRTVFFKPGEAAAELNEDGVYYLVRNMIALSGAPVIVNGRTLIPLDVLALLGLRAEIASDGVLDVWSTPPAAQVEVGTISKIEAGERFRFLLEGAPMSSGEPSLTWFTLTEDAVITVGDKPGTTADLTVGQTVEVTVAGPLLLSYPAQGSASAVRVIPSGENETE